jgi:flagellar biosynthetic protein FliP
MKAAGLLGLASLAWASPAQALTFALGSSPAGASLSVVPGANGSSEAVQLVVLLTVLALVPLAIMMCSAFTRILVVFALLRQALGLQQVPPTPILIGLSLFLSGFVMMPTIQRLENEAFKPMSTGRLPVAQALKKAEAPLRDFMLRQVREEDLATFAATAMSGMPGSAAQVPTWVLAPAFMLSELRIAFKIGFLVFLPFLIVDLMVAAVLNAMGLMMLPPTVFSAPLKLLLFTLVDGWGLLAQQLIHSFR